MSDVKVGRILGPDDKRDAIHVAIAPATAAVQMAPGEPVLLYRDGTAGPYNDFSSQFLSAKQLGIADPFLTKHVERGQRFYIFLLPGTVTGMRHSWQHPAFDDEAADWKELPAPPVQADSGLVEASKLWLRDFAAEWHFDYDTMVEAGVSGDYVVADGIDLHSRGELGDDEPLFWHHLEIVTGRKFSTDHRENMGWSCSC